MVKIEAKGGDGYNGGKGGEGGKVSLTVGMLIELGNLENVIMTNNINQINASFEQALKQIEEDPALEPEQKSKARQTVEGLWNAFKKAEPYARPYIVEILRKLATGS